LKNPTENAKKRKVTSKVRSEPKESGQGGGWAMGCGEVDRLEGGARSMWRGLFMMNSL
jgi:hypothetical protein